MVIWINSRFEIPVTIYGESLSELKVQVREWLASNQPKLFSNLASTQEQKQRYSYAYLEGENRPIVSKKDPFDFDNDNINDDEKVVLEEGWYSVDNQGQYSWQPKRYQDFNEVISHFIGNAMVPKKGPDYKEIELNELQFPLPLIRKVRREENELKVNDLLQRGWYVIALDSKGHEDYYGRQVVSRTTVYVLGHQEEDAD